MSLDTARATSLSRGARPWLNAATASPAASYQSRSAFWAMARLLRRTISATPAAVCAAISAKWAEYPPANASAAAEAASAP